MLSDDHFVRSAKLQKAFVHCVSRAVLCWLSIPGFFAAELGGGLNAAENGKTAGLVFFENKIRPVLVDKCYRCHSAQSKKLKAGLMLDHRSRLLKGGESGASIRPGDAQQSLLIETLIYQNPDLQMPPKSKLADEVIADFEKWINMGAPWPEELVPQRVRGSADSAVIEVEGFDIKKRKAAHWSWQAIRSADLPQLKDRNWAEGEIDQFILAKLEQADLLPAEEAAPSRWLRRVYFDLIGLPPSPLQSQNFLEDKKKYVDSTQAEQSVVDQLLASPHYGERWARHWMDLVRFAETAGHEFDFPIAHAWRYRDYLIRAFNRDLPYDQFVIEHLAGDLIASPRRDPETHINESLLATGFWFLNESVHGPTDVLADESDRMDNQIDVLGKTFLGLTLGCARCHDHKFDAISTADYYALCGMLQSSRRQTAFLDPKGEISADAQKARQIYQQGEQQLRQLFDGGESSEKEQADLLAEYLLAAQQVVDQSALKPKRAGVLIEVAQQRGLRVDTLKNWVNQLAQAGKRGEGSVLHAWYEMNKGGKAALQSLVLERAVEKGRSIDFRQEAISILPSETSSWTFTGQAFHGGLSKSIAWTGAIVEQGLLEPSGVFNSGRYGKKLEGVLRSSTFKLTGDRIHLRLNGKAVKVRLVVDGFYMNRFSQLLFAGTVIKSKNIDTKGEYRWFTMKGSLDKYQGHQVWLEISDEGEGYVSVAEVLLTDEDLPNNLASIGGPIFEERQFASASSLASAYGQYWAASVNHLRGGDLDAAGVNGLNFLWRHQLWPAGEDSLKKIDQVLLRLQAWDQSLSKPSYALAMIDGSPEDERIHIRGSHKRLGKSVGRRNLEALGGQGLSQSSSGRLQLAKYWTSAENPLLSRVMVNRLWHQLFGRGLVATVDDFGDMGLRPSHPQLLDWLATDFMDGGWSIKKTLRKMALSKTYRMSSVANARTSRQRLAEIDPENLLLHRSSIRRIQGEAIRDAMLLVSGSLDEKIGGPSIPVHLTSFMEGRGRPAKSGPLDGANRRSLYLELRRNFLSPFMLTFDMPAPFNTMGRRSVSNVPAQALAMMNDPFVSDQASRWALRLSHDKEMSKRKKIEQMFLQAFARQPSVEESRQALVFLHEQSSDSEQAWRDLCHVLFNKKEFIYIR